MKMIITLHASPSFQPLSYSELITYASVWIMHGAIDMYLDIVCFCTAGIAVKVSFVILKCKLLKSFDVLMKYIVFWQILLVYILHLTHKMLSSPPLQILLKE